MVDAAEAANIDTILEYCGFTIQANRTSISEDGFKSFADLLSLTDYDMGILQSALQKSLLRKEG